MCIIVYKPWNATVDIETLRTCFANNPDGAGYMFPGKGRLRIKKGFFTFRDFHDAWEKTQEIHGHQLPVVFHFRIATAGRIDHTNCHPHHIARDLGFVHNGILSCVHVPKRSHVSDTIIYRDRYLGNLTGKRLRNPNLFRAISRHIGSGNKFVFMNGAGNVVICNEEQGIWQDELWFSNHSFLPRWSDPFKVDSRWFCEYCGKLLETGEEALAGICRDCFKYCESGSVECGGCYRMLSSFAHRELGWCDECGFEIYGRDLPTVLLEAESYTEESHFDRF